MWHYRESEALLHPFVEFPQRAVGCSHFIMSSKKESKCFCWIWIFFKMSSFLFKCYHWRKAEQSRGRVSVFCRHRLLPDGLMQEGRGKAEGDCSVTQHSAEERIFWLCSGERRRWNISTPPALLNSSLVCRWISDTLRFCPASSLTHWWDQLF